MVKVRHFQLFSIVSLFVFSIIICVKPLTARGDGTAIKNEINFDNMMRTMQINTENLHIAFEKRDWQKIEKLALEIANGCSALKTGKEEDIPLEFDDFKLSSENLHDYAYDVVQASKKMDIEAAKSAYKKMEGTCTSCHDKFRK